MNLKFLSSISVKGVYATLLSGTTICGVKLIENGTCLANTYLATGGTATCATSAIDSKALCGCVPAFYFLLSGGTAVNSSKLGGQLPAYYLNTGSTAVCATTAGNALCLGGQLPSYYMNATVGLTGATNGLSISNQNISLGGNLTQCTYLRGGYCFDVNAVQGFNIVTSGNTDINIDAQQWATVAHFFLFLPCRKDC